MYTYIYICTNQRNTQTYSQINTQTLHRQNQIQEIRHALAELKGREAWQKFFLLILY